jgi:hypothetical protein
VLGAHHREHGTGDGEQAEDVGVEHRADLGVGGLLDGPEQAPPGVVDEHVDPAEPVDISLFPLVSSSVAFSTD